MSGAGLIVNPRSHGVARRGSALAAVAAGLRLRPVMLEDFGALNGEVAAMARAGVGRIFVEGGDGTVLGVLSACLAPASGFARMPEICILPGGSTNLAFRVAGLKGRTRGGIGRRAAALLAGGRGEAAEHRALVVEGASLPCPVAGFVLSTGALARAMRHAQSEFLGGGRRGSAAVAGAILRFVAAPFAHLDGDGRSVLRASPLTLAAEGRVFEGPHAFLIASTLPRLSLGLRPFWGRGPGGIALTHAAWPVGAFRRSVLRLMVGRGAQALARAGFTSLRCDALEFETDGPVMMDGEILPVAPGARLGVSVSAPVRFLR